MWFSSYASFVLLYGYGSQTQEKISQVDAMLLAIGKRVLDMDSGVEALNNMRDAVDKFSLDQITLKESVED